MRKADEKVGLRLRFNEKLRRRLEQAAARNEQSMNAEIIHRLEASFVDEERFVVESFGTPEVFGIMKIIAAAMLETGRVAGFYSGDFNAGFQWIDDPYAYDQAVKAATRVLEALRPPGSIENPSLPAPVNEIGTPAGPSRDDMLRMIGSGFANTMLGEAASGKSRAGNPESQKRAQSLHDAVGRLAKRLLEKGIQY